MAEIFRSDFEADQDGFAYADDVFRASSQPQYADGVYGSTSGETGGGVTVSLGGANNDDILGMSGGFSRGFTLTEPTTVSLTFKYNLTHAANFESDEFSQVLFSLDGNLMGTSGNDYVAQISGNGNGGSADSTGWVEVTLDLGELAAGDHTIALGADGSDCVSTRTPTNPTSECSCSRNRISP